MLKANVFASFCQLKLPETASSLVRMPTLPEVSHFEMALTLSGGGVIGPVGLVLQALISMVKASMQSVR
jgi:hypothetical protein